MGSAIPAAHSSRGRQVSVRHRHFGKQFSCLLPRRTVFLLVVRWRQHHSCRTGDLSMQMELRRECLEFGREDQACRGRKVVVQTEVRRRMKAEDWNSSAGAPLLRRAAHDAGAAHRPQLTVADRFDTPEGGWMPCLANASRMNKPPLSCGRQRMVRQRRKTAAER